MLKSDNMQDNYDIMFLAPKRNRYVTTNAPLYSHICISRYIAKSGFTSRVYGGNIIGCNNSMQDAISGKTKIAAFGCHQDDYAMALHMAKALKRYGITIIFGDFGEPQAYSMNEKEMRLCDVDFVLVGEAEITINRLLRYLLRGEGSLSAIPGIRYIDEGGTYHDNGYPDVIQDLDSALVVDDTDNIYIPAESGIIDIMTSRGCPLSCAFCNKGTNAAVRYRSVENVMQEIDAYLKRFKTVREFRFTDNTFTLDPERVRRFCAEMKKRNLKWSCEAHVGKLAKHPELIEEMVDAGLVGAQIGIESGSTDVLKAYFKHARPELVVDVVRRFHEAGCPSVQGNFIIGGALESPKTLEDSIRLAERLLEIGHLMMEVYTVYYVPFSNTPIGRCPEQYEMYILENPDNYTRGSASTCLNRTKAMTRREIQEGRELFDKRLKEKYLSELEKVTYAELQRYVRDFMSGKTLKDGFWFYHLKHVNTVSNFMKYGFYYQDFTNYDAVPVRSFGDLVYENDALRVGSRLFFGNEKTFLERANGSVTFREMAGIMNMMPHEVMRIYKGLRDKLLVYMERF